MSPHLQTLTMIDNASNEDVAKRLMLSLPYKVEVLCGHLAKVSSALGV